MKQERIRYGDVMDLGFKDEEQNDKMFFNEYGYPWRIISKDLTKRISIDWDQTTQLCQMIRCDKELNIKGRLPIKDLDHLKEVVEFFCEEIEYPPTVC